MGKVSFSAYNIHLHITFPTCVVSRHTLSTSLQIQVNSLQTPAAQGSAVSKQEGHAAHHKQHRTNLEHKLCQSLFLPFLLESLLPPHADKPGCTCLALAWNIRLKQTIVALHLPEYSPRLQQWAAQGPPGIKVVSINLVTFNSSFFHRLAPFPHIHTDIWHSQHPVARSLPGWLHTSRTKLLLGFKLTPCNLFILLMEKKKKEGCSPS